MSENRVFNFSAGPSMLPESVLIRARDEMLNYNGSGMSVMEMSHRSKVYDEIIKATEAKLRSLLNIPDNYKVLFLQGGASLQFASVPLNLLKSGKADYIVTGQFSGTAAKEAKKYADVNVVADMKEENYARIPSQDELKLSPDADYVHICVNNTIFGTHWNYLLDTGNVPLVGDMSSCILSEVIDVTKYGVIYAGAQKNMAPAGLTVAIVRDDLLGYAREDCPTVMNYKIMAEKESMFNTPSTYPIYVCGLVLDWIESLGGVAEIEKINRAKAKLLYDCLDESKLFIPHADIGSRSLMNVTFRTGNEDLDAQFVKEAGAKGFVSIKGHRSVGGMRASIYNAMPVEGIEKLVEFMREFEVKNK